MEPLAERLRPRKLDDYVGQRHLVGEGKVLRVMNEDTLPVSIITRNTLPSPTK